MSIDMENLTNQSPHDSVTADAPALPFPSLSSRERQIATMLAMGSTNREISDDLKISIKTVDTHRGHILKKIGLRNNAELARAAIRAGLTTL
jgi:DNA-binding NarL/FixJ family response regulator